MYTVSHVTVSEITYIIKSFDVLGKYLSKQRLSPSQFRFLKGVKYCEVQNL